MKRRDRENLRIAFILTAGVGCFCVGCAGNLSHNHTSKTTLAAAGEESEYQHREIETIEEVSVINSEYLSQYVYTTADITLTTPTEFIESAETTLEALETTIEETTIEIPTEAQTVPYSASSEATEAFTESNARFTEREQILLLKTASCEASSQGSIGLALVMRTVLNRCEISGADIESVIYMPGQYACTESELWYQDYIVPEAYQALDMVMNGWDESQGATYFCTPAHNQWHRSALTYLYTYGEHEFYR